MTITSLNKDLQAVQREHRGIYTGPVAYAAPGEAVVLGDLGIGSHIDLIQVGVALNAAGTVTRLVVWDRTNATLRWFVPNTGAEVADGTDLSGYSAPITVNGI